MTPFQVFEKAQTQSILSFSLIGYKRKERTNGKPHGTRYKSDRFQSPAPKTALRIGDAFRKMQSPWGKCKARNRNSPGSPIQSEVLDFPAIAGWPQGRGNFPGPRSLMPSRRCFGRDPLNALPGLHALGGRLAGDTAAHWGIFPDGLRKNCLSCFHCFMWGCRRDALTYEGSGESKGGKAKGVRFSTGPLLGHKAT